MRKLRTLLWGALCLVLTAGCATTTRYWSGTYESPRVLSKIREGGEVVLLLKGRREVRGVFRGVRQDTVLLEVVDEGTDETQLRRFPLRAIWGVAPKRVVRVNWFLFGTVALLIAVVVDFYFWAWAMGRALD